MRLVDEQQEVTGEVIHQGERRGPRWSPLEDARVVLDAVAIAKLAQHLQVVLGALPDAVGLQQLAVLLEAMGAVFHLAHDLLRRALDRDRVRHVVGGGIDDEFVELPEHLAR